MLTCYDVADYFLSLADDGSSGELLSNLKLQKLVYYAQGLYLALYDAPLFPQPIEAWTHGPVVPALYQKYRECGSVAITNRPMIDVNKYDARTTEVLNEAFTVYGQFSAWKLRDMTHDEDPWKDAYAQGPNTEITLEALANYFKTQIIG